MTKRLLPAPGASWRGLRWAALALLLVEATWLVVLFVPALPQRLKESGSLEVLFADQTPAFVFLSADDKFRVPATTDAVSGHYVDALVRFEDKRFRWHPGIDPLAIARALVLNARQGEVVSGASTLTLQLVRVLEPRPRTVRSKLLEVLRALQIEARLSKQEILEAYLTFAPYGRNVEGVVAASWSYFGHGPEALSPAEIATLLAVPQSPSRRYPSVRNTQRLREARQRIGSWLEREGVFASNEASFADTAAVPARLRTLPRSAAHAAFWLRDQSSSGERSTISTTLNRGLQETAEDILASARDPLRQVGIHNASVVLVDHQNRAVQALVGNFDFWDREHGGQLAGFNVARSTGSALKPLIYALGIDRGVALPDHLVVDAPVYYGDYSPDNYDGSFVGLIRLEEALSLSLNIPFVRLLSQVGMAPFLEALSSAGVRSLVDREGHYGLSAAIGALEMTPLEMARLYVSLANDGRDAPLHIVRDPSGGTMPEQELYGPAAAFLTRKALSKRDRPDFPDRYGATTHTGFPIHWKTGTSYGHRDAWAVGSGPNYTAVVWLGNLDATSAFDLVGAQAAGPILFDVLEAAEGRTPTAQSRQEWPQELNTVEVCAWSGHLPNTFCPLKKQALAPRTSVATRRCPLHTRRDIDRATGHAVLPGCRTGRQVEQRVFRVWPDAVRRLYEQRGARLPELPPVAPECRSRPARLAASRLRLLSPSPDAAVVLIPGISASEQELPLRLAGGSGEVTWFMDGRLLTRADAGQEVWWRPVLGHHEVYAVTQSGGEVRREFDVLSGRSSSRGPSRSVTRSSVRAP